MDRCKGQIKEPIAEGGGDRQNHSRQLFLVLYTVNQIDFG